MAKLTQTELQIKASKMREAKARKAGEKKGINKGVRKGTIWTAIFIILIIGLIIGFACLGTYLGWFNFSFGIPVPKK